jgi:hypothetical protein
VAVIRLYDLARMTTATTSTGTITLGAAVSGFLTFAGAGVANGETVRYAIRDGANSEVGTGVYTSAGTTLTRTPIKSTNANAAINLSGTAEVAIVGAAEDFRQIYLDNGAVGTPSLTFGSDDDTGIYRIGANNIGVAANGAKVLDIATTGLGVTGTLGVSGVASVTNTTEVGVGSGALVISGGLYTAKAVAIASTTASSSTTVGALTVAGGVGVGGNVHVGGNLVLPGVGNTISFSQNSGIIAMGNKSINANGNIADTISYGIGIYRDNTLGCTAIVLFDGGNLPVILGQTSSGLFVNQASDPGVGGNKWVIYNSPSLGVVNNRFSGSQALWRCLIGVGVSIAS